MRNIAWRKETKEKQKKKKKSHILGVEHLRSELRDSESSEVDLRSSGERSKADEEEVESREGDQVGGQFSQVGVQLSRESERARRSAHHQGDELVEISIGGVGQLQGSEANIVQLFDGGKRKGNKKKKNKKREHKKKKNWKRTASLSMHMQASTFSRSW
jgi:hypothetical protein